MVASRRPEPAPETSAEPAKRWSRSEAARRLGISTSALCRWENALPRDVAVHAGIKALPVEVDDQGQHRHDARVIAQVATAVARAQIQTRGRRRGPGELHANIFQRLQAGRSVAEIVCELRLDTDQVLRLARIYRDGDKGGTIVPARLAQHLSAALGTAEANPAKWVAAADALRLLIRRRTRTEP